MRIVGDAEVTKDRQPFVPQDECVNFPVSDGRQCGSNRDRIAGHGFGAYYFARVIDQNVEFNRALQMPARHDQLKQPFTVADIRGYWAGEFAENYIRTALANYVEDTGDYVHRWSEPRFRRVGRGLHELVG
jgi:hypothetical protein